jgi:hypothetical protein
MYRGVGSFRDARAFSASAGHGRAALGLAQRRWIALSKKRKVVLRFDVSLPPFPRHGPVFICWRGGCDVWYFNCLQASAILMNRAIGYMAHKRLYCSIGLRFIITRSVVAMRCVAISSAAAWALWRGVEFGRYIRS